MAPALDGAIIAAPTAASPGTAVTRSNSQFLVQLFREQSVPLTKYLTARFRDPEEAAEVAQEAWLRIHRLEDPSLLTNPKAFLFQTASNIAIDRARRNSVERRAAARPVDPPDAHPSAERSVAAAESLTLIAQALEELPSNCRQAFLMHRGRDMSYPEIASALGVSTSMVEKYIIRALKHFRDRLSV
jgi:RNA polymerase sigma-70 factor (ECF subfamily)